MDDDNPLHYIESPSFDSDELCDVCQEIDIRGLFYQKDAYIWDSYVERPPDRSLKHIMEHQQCPFCRLTMAAILGVESFSTNSPELVPVRAIVSATGLLSLHRSGWDTDADISRPLCRLWFYDGNVPKRLNPAFDEFDWEPGESFTIQLLQPDTHSSLGWEETAERNYRHARLITNRIQPDLIRRWLVYCERHHNDVEDEESSEREHVPIRLVDVESLRVVDASTSWRYVALSYIWGTSTFLNLNQTNRAELYGQHGLSRVDVPRTISDAMTLCAQLGERYLWVDSLCIMQDSEDDKSLQIQHMEMVYQMAVMTIANASKGNNSANSPLPGVQANSRLPFQQVHNIAGLKLVVSRAYPQARAKQMSAWATRAWTMQEELLSGRVLYISDTHCWFQCRDCYFSEDVFLESVIDASKLSISPRHTFFTDMRKRRQRPWRGHELGPTSMQIHSNFELSKPDVPVTLGEVFELIEIYTKRRATLQSDALKAVEGLLRKATTLDHGLTTTYLYGLPVAAFDYALCWMEGEHDPTRRRRNFPSWSWADWMSPVQFPMGVPSYGTIGKTFPAMSLYTNAVLNSDAKTFDLNARGTWQSGLENLRTFEGTLEENRSFEDLSDFYGICVSPKALVRSHHPLGDERSQSLVFRTSWAKLRVAALPRDCQIPNLAETSSCKLYTLTSPANAQAEFGVIRLNQAWRDSEPEVLDLDFIVIRASPSEEFEPWWHSSKKPKESRSPGPADWNVFLMCIAWIDSDLSEDKARKAERITMAGVHEHRGITRHRDHKNERETARFLYTVGDWMKVQPRPSEVLVELT